MNVPVCTYCRRVECICATTPANLKEPRPVRASRSRALAAALTAVAALGLLAACGANGPHGTVTGKDHKAAHTSWHTVPKTKRVCTTTSRRVGKTTSRSSSCRNVPDGTRSVADVRPECWELELDTGQELCVSADTWRHTHVGDTY